MRISRLGRPLAGALFLGAITLAGVAHAQNYDRDRDNQNRDRDDQYRYQQQQNYYRSFDWRHRPRWVSVPGAQVQIVARRDQPDFDAFRENGFYYVWDGDSWYRSRNLRDDYVVISDQDVPWDVHQVPRYQWQHYPDAWMYGGAQYDRDRYDRNDRNRNRGDRWRDHDRWRDSHDRDDDHR